MKKSLLLALAVMCAAQAFSKVWTVRSRGGNYTSLATAVANASTAIAAGDTIDVLGTFVGKVVNASTTPKTLVIQGHGVDSTSVLFAATQSATAVTSGAVFYLDGDLSTSNFTIKNMTIANANSSYSGGGVRVNNTGASNVTIQLDGLKITNNIAVNGGGLSVGGRAVVGITNCNITANTATSTSGGGGIVFTTSTANIPVIATIKNTTISNNISSAYGGAGIAVWSRGTVSTPSSLWIENSTIYGNSVTSTGKFGAGIYVKNVEALAPFTLTLNHCTVSNNSTSAGVGGDGIGVDNNSLTATTLVMNNSIILGNSGSTSNISQVGVGASSPTSVSIVNGGINNSFFTKLTAATWFPATAANNNNNITGSANMAFAPTLSSDAVPVLVIGAASAARDYVVNDYLSNPLAKDQLGNSRFGYADAGAYEYNTNIAVTASATTGGVISTDPTGVYASGVSVTAVASATGVNDFKYWTVNGVVVSTNAAFTFPASKSCALVANFSPKFTVSVVSYDDNMGTVTGGGAIAYGASTTMTATPKSGYVFTGWSIDTAFVTPPSSMNWTLIPMANCTATANFKSIYSAYPSTPTYARTANTIDLFWTPLSGAPSDVTYSVLNGTTVVASGLTACSATVGSLIPNSSYNFSVMAQSCGVGSQLSMPMTAYTRKLKNSSIEVLDDFENGTTMGWAAANGSVVTVPFANADVNDINTSAYCAKVFVDISKVNYCGLANNKECVKVGPNAPYQYLHLKMYRDADNGTIGLTFNARTDIVQAQFSSVENPSISTVSATGPWVDYVFNLKDPSFTTDKTVYGFYLKINKTTANTTIASNSYVDDIYLSNDGTPSTANVTLPVLLSASAGGTVTQTLNTYLPGDVATVKATGKNGGNFINWTENGTIVSTQATYTFTVSAARSLMANFTAPTTGLDQLFDAHYLQVKGRVLQFVDVIGTVEVFDFMGRLVIAQSVLDAPIYLKEGGVYIVKMATNEGWKVQKVVIQ